jgi:hypothetical protein
MVQAPSDLRVFLLDAGHLVSARKAVREGDPELIAAVEELRKEADALLSSRLVSVMDKSITPPSGDKHDYMSQAPYFWPDPKSSNGLPYIRRDGERNPEINKIPDHGNILGMPEKVQTLALAWFFTGQETYAAKATAFLRAWFSARHRPDRIARSHESGGRGGSSGRIGILDVERSAGAGDVVRGVPAVDAGKRLWARRGGGPEQSRHVLRFAGGLFRFVPEGSEAGD